MYIAIAEWDHNISVTGGSIYEVTEAVFEWFNDNPEYKEDGSYRFFVHLKGNLSGKPVCYCYSDYYSDW